MAKRYNTREVAEMTGWCVQGVQKKLKLNHFPNAELCECKRTTLIPMTDIKAAVKTKRTRK